MEKPPPPINSNGKSEKWVRVVQGVVGAAILGLQGVNISETNNQTHLIQRIDHALYQQSELIRTVTEEGQRIDKAIDNQEKMLENQNVALDFLQKQSAPTK